MHKVLTLENTGVDVQDFLAEDGVMYSIMGNTCRDIPAGIANKMVEAFPQLKVIGGMEFEEEETVLVEDINTEEVKQEEAPTVPTNKEEFENSLRKEEKFICSICDREFNKMHGLRIHQKSHE